MLCRSSALQTTLGSEVYRKENTSHRLEFHSLTCGEEGSLTDGHPSSGNASFGMLLSVYMEAAMISDFYFKILFLSNLAEGNSTCQCCILGSKEGEPGPAEAALKQWPCGRGLQRQCTEGRGICMPRARLCTPQAWAPCKHTLFPRLCTWSCVCLPLPCPRILRCSVGPGNILGKSESKW